MVYQAPRLHRCSPLRDAHTTSRILAHFRSSGRWLRRLHGSPCWSRYWLYRHSSFHGRKMAGVAQGDGAAHQPRRSNVRDRYRSRRWTVLPAVNPSAGSFKTFEDGWNSGQESRRHLDSHIPKPIATSSPCSRGACATPTVRWFAGTQQRVRRQHNPQSDGMLLHVRRSSFSPRAG